MLPLPSISELNELNVMPRTFNQVWRTRTAMNVNIDVKNETRRRKKAQLCYISVAEATIAVAGILFNFALLLSEHFMFDLDQKQWKR